MFINNINGVINKNVSLFFFPSDIKLAWKAKQKQRELTKNQHFFYFFVFFLKIQDIRKSKTPIFERWEHKNFLDQVLTIFQTGPHMPQFRLSPCTNKLNFLIRISLQNMNASVENCGFVHIFEKVPNVRIFAHCQWVASNQLTWLKKNILGNENVLLIHVIFGKSRQNP